MTPDAVVSQTALTIKWADFQVKRGGAGSECGECGVLKIIFSNGLKRLFCFANFTNGEDAGRLIFR